jgi:hypothetical protein
MAVKKSEQLTPIADVAKDWSVSEKTISNWVEFIYQGFDVVLPSNGPFPDWGVELLTLCGKHVSSKASLYFAETGQKRRLKGTEFVTRVRALRQGGHFQDLQKHQNLQESQEPEDDLEDELFAEASQLSRQSTDEITEIKGIIEASEDRQVEGLVDFIKEPPNRKKRKLVNALRASDLRDAMSSEQSLLPTLDVVFTEVPLLLEAEDTEVPELLALAAEED